MESNPEMSGDADFRNPDIRQNRRGFFMPKNFVHAWRVIPKCREMPILETPIFVRIVGVSLYHAPLDL